jgi:CSN8/PSMD8/EIF3K family
MAAAALPPVEHYTFFLKSLLETVRVNIGECAAASYSVLTIEAATKVLMFNDEKVPSPLI